MYACEYNSWGGTEARCEKSPDSGAESVGNRERGIWILSQGFNNQAQ